MHWKIQKYKQNDSFLFSSFLRMYIPHLKLFPAHSLPIIEVFFISSSLNYRVIPKIFLSHRNKELKLVLLSKQVSSFLKTKKTYFCKCIQELPIYLVRLTISPENPFTVSICTVIGNFILRGYISIFSHFPSKKIYDNNCPFNSLVRFKSVFSLATLGHSDEIQQ